MGVNALLDVEVYNVCFETYFNFSIMSVLVGKRYNDMQLIYIYGLAKLCGYSAGRVAIYIGHGNSYLAGHCVRVACKKMCRYDSIYSLEFTDMWKDFRRFCRPYGKRLSKKERDKRYREKKKRQKGA
jgi:hypothetical protein